jgi:hypothetical protein
MILQIFSACASDAIARNFLLRHAEISAAVLDESIPLFETALVQQ